MALTLDEANRIAAGAIAHAASIDILVCVAVCDAGGRLVSFQRMDGAIWAAVYGCQGKAVASAAFGRPSGDLTERADHPTFRGIVAAEGGHMILGRGGVPIMRDGEVIGACGVGGGTGEEDGGVRARRRLAHLDVSWRRAGVALLQPEILTPDIARRATPSGRERASSRWPDVPHRARARVDARRAAQLSPGGSRKHTRLR